MMRKQAAGTAALASVIVSGCSAILVRPTPTVRADGEPVCGPPSAPVLDATIGTPALVGVGYFVDHFCPWREGGRCGPAHVTSYIPAMITAASAAYGFWALSQCHARLKELPRDGVQPFPLTGR